MPLRPCRPTDPGARHRRRAVVEADAQHSERRQRADRRRCSTSSDSATRRTRPAPAPTSHRPVPRTRPGRPSGPSNRTARPPCSNPPPAGPSPAARVRTARPLERAVASESVGTAHRDGSGLPSAGDDSSGELRHGGEIALDHDVDGRHVDVSQRRGLHWRSIGRRELDRPVSRCAERPCGDRLRDRVEDGVWRRGSRVGRA